MGSPEGRGPSRKEMSAALIRTPESYLPTSLSCEGTEQTPSMSWEVGPPRHTKSVGALTSDSQASRTVRHKRVLFKSRPPPPTI